MTEPSLTLADSDSFAALDLGTNNCRLLIGAPVRGGFRIVDSVSRMVRLGEELHDSGALGEAGMARAMLALHGCVERLARRPPRAIRAIATEACRRASNGAAFLARVRAETGLDFSVISAREEAELALESCGPLLEPLAAGGANRGVLFDIGGGSTEVAWVRLSRHERPSLAGVVSLPIGVADMAARMRQVGFDRLVDEVAERLRPFEEVHRITQEIRHDAGRGGVIMLGTSGTATTLAGVALGLSRYRRPMIDGVVLSRADLDGALARLRGFSPGALAAHPCVGSDRADFVLPGCAIFAAIHRTWPMERVSVADRGLREGMMLRMIREQHRSRHHATALAGAPAQGR